jgi:hypothetical protein
MIAHKRHYNRTDSFGYIDIHRQNMLRREEREMDSIAPLIMPKGRERIQALTPKACYDYEGEVLVLDDCERCPDCTTPTVWIEDRNGPPRITKIYHDPSCTRVRCGQGEVAPTREEHEHE